MKIEMRKTLLVDATMQSRIARNMISTWMVAGGLVLAFPAFFSVLSGIFVGDQPLHTVLSDVGRTVLFPIVGALLLVPVGIRHSIRFGNRIAGPVYRMKRQINSVRKGESVKPIQLRKGDYLTDLAEHIDQLLEEHTHLKAEVERYREAENHSVDQPREKSGIATDSKNPLLPSVIYPVETEVLNLSGGYQRIS